MNKIKNTMNSSDITTITTTIVHNRTVCDWYREWAYCIRFDL